jgi:hypothetical protein
MTKRAASKSTSLLEREMSEDSEAPPSEGLLERIRDLGRRARDKELEIAHWQERLGTMQSELLDLKQVKLVEAMHSAGVDHIGIEREGNMPAYDFELSSYCRANIAAAWDEKRRAAAFAALEQRKAGDLIKTTITIEIPREQRSLAKRVTVALRKLKVDFSLREAVNSQTLGKWLRESIKRKLPVPPLDVIGGAVGEIVEFKARKET